MTLTPKAQKVLMTLYYKRKFDRYDGGWMRVQTIRNICGFEKAETVLDGLCGLVYKGIVETERQSLLDGEICNFYRIAEPLPDGLEIELSANIKFPEEKI